MALINVFTWGRYKKRMATRSNIESALWLKIRELSVARFKYENLPEGIEPYHIERTLFDMGTIGFGKLAGQIIALPLTEASTINMYGDVNEFGMYSTVSGKMLSNLKNGKTGVVVKNNLDSISTMALLTPWVKQLADIWTGMAINRRNSRTFAAMSGTKDQAKAMKRQYMTAMESEDGMIFFANSKQFKIEKFDLKIEYVPEKYWDDYNRTWQSLLEFLGYQNNSAAEKKARVVVDEVNLGSEMTRDFMDTMLSYRETGIERINKMFGTNITVTTTTPAVDTTAPGAPEEEED